MSARKRFPWRTAGWTCLAVGASSRLVSIDDNVVRLPSIGVLVGGSILLALIVWFRVIARRGTRATLARWDKRDKRSGGVASHLDHVRVSGRLAMLRRARVVRPSLASLSLWELLRLPVTEYATEIARSGWHKVYSSHEDVTLRVGGPRTGKTGELACRVVDAPGAAVVTSTRLDIYGLTVASRERLGPIHVFNPSGLGGLATTIKWSPLVGCRVPAIAQRRATDLIPESTSADGARWDMQARRILAVLLHAAALIDAPARTVLGWVSDPRNPKVAQAVDDALSRSPEARSMQLAAVQFFMTNDRTQTSITSSVMPALAWLTDPLAARVGDAQGDDLLDVYDLIAQRGTLYLLGGEDSAGIVAPLIAALTAEVAHQARMIAAGRPNGRLDPPLALCLDEAALICPVPLDRWTADMGGRGVTIHISIQSAAQMRQRWGDDGAATILNNTASIMVYGGTRAPDDLRMWALLSGDRDAPTETTDAAGNVTSRSTRPTSILTEGDIAGLPAGHVMIVRRGMRVCIGRTRMAWKRRDIKRTNRAAVRQRVQETRHEEALREEVDA